MNDFDLMDYDFSKDEEMHVSNVARNIGDYIESLLLDDEQNNERYNILMNKVYVCHQKINMMWYGKAQALEALNDFEVTQNMTFPALFGRDEMRLLYNTESMILFARTALDAAAYVFSDIIFNSRKDSFNDFYKSIDRSEDERFYKLKEYFIKEAEDNISAFRLLCGVTRGRALRDIVAHQSNIKLFYSEYEKGNEHEKLFMIIDKQSWEYRFILEHFCEGVETLLLNVLKYVKEL